MNVGIYPPRQRYILARHDFFMEQVKSRVLGNFANLEEEANTVAEKAWQDFMNQPSDGEDDPADFVDSAMDAGLEFFEYASEMKRQVTLASLATLYHQWEKDIRSHLENEHSHGLHHATAGRKVWRAGTPDILDFLEKRGWPVRQAAWYPLLDACRLIVNVYKHGKGRSFDELTQEYPQYLKDEASSEIPMPKSLIVLDHENLELTEQEFDELAEAVRQFWQEFPDVL